MDPRWRQLQLWHRLSFGLWLGWVPFGGVMITAGARVLPRPLPWILIGAYMLAFMASGWRGAFALCPACGRTFGIGPKFLRFDSPWAPRCRNCGIKLGAPLESPTPRG